MLLPTKKGQMYNTFVGGNKFCFGFYYYVGELMSCYALFGYFMGPVGSLAGENGATLSGG